MKPESSACSNPPSVIGQMSEAEIMAHFEMYEFRDSRGHKLTMCQDFIELAKSAASANQYGK